MTDFVKGSEVRYVRSRVSNGWNFWEGQLEMARPNEDGIYEFDFLIEHALTMTTLQKDKITSIIDYSPDELFWTKRNSDFHSKCNKNETILNGTEKIEKMDHLLSTLLQWDGKHQKLITINGKSPGDPIVVPFGAKVIIRIRNHLFTQAITLHMHGMKMQNRWWNDGVPYIQQCPISPGSVYTYNFIADSPGTHWYHGHLMGDRSMGLLGGFIVSDDKILPFYRTGHPNLWKMIELILTTVFSQQVRAHPGHTSMKKVGIAKMI
uniref:Plastocyanin-like domain-containing protein n=1 Tax=Globodera rostochiensis TaxID=31243 RepID=A0A914HL64_GLORO